jgi:hypothetical protein
LIVHGRHDQPNKNKYRGSFEYYFPFFFSHFFSPYQNKEAEAGGGATGFSKLLTLELLELLMDDDDDDDIYYEYTNEIGNVMLCVGFVKDSFFSLVNVGGCRTSVDD